MQCPVCLERFNTSDRQPFDACINRHCYCGRCLELLLTQSKVAKCPECRVPILRKSIALNRAARGIIQEIANSDHTNLTLDAPKISVEDRSALPETIVEEPFQMPLFWLKTLIVALLGWTTPIVTWVYIFELGGWFQLALAYFVLYRFYQLVRNREQFETGKLRLLLKLGLFGMLEEIGKGEIFFYVQYSVRWLGSVIGLVLLHSYFGHEWSPLAIATLSLNILSVVELLIGRFFLKRLLDYAVQPGYECLPSVTLVGTILVGLVTAVTNLAHIGMNWYPSVIIYLVCWLANFIYSLVAKSRKSCCQSLGTGFLLLLSFPYSIGMFVWLAVRNSFTRVPAYIMMVLRYLVCPMASVLLLVLTSKLSQQHSQLLMAGQLLSTMQLGLGIYVLSR